MKTQAKTKCCRRCGTRLSRCEQIYLEGDLCALCDQILSEAMDIFTAPRPKTKGAPLRHL
ncbi:hypothetical protein BJL95_15405 [Methylomonas sp. LWB]|uniref:hypothetical protein n=1 Tax=Methylomonas sp. LWB TaxID=1905845 RepID=UPI0008DA407E|nr:hypothetical protein [Methylomonas sp. LWB]OHX35610.1 hypothetical protein BJL95_15405 [Methylomonas sp. LWB]